jgi:hypothetical protein
LAGIRGRSVVSREGHPPSPEKSLLPDFLQSQNLQLPLPSDSLQPIKANDPDHSSQKLRERDLEKDGSTELTTENAPSPPKDDYLGDAESDEFNLIDWDQIFSVFCAESLTSPIDLGEDADKGTTSQLYADLE